MPQLKITRKFGRWLLLVLIALPMPISAQTNKTESPEKLSKTQQEILQVEEEIFTAVKNQDTQTLERILTDDFIYRSPGNPAVVKEDFLKLAASFPLKIVSVWGEEMKVNVYGNTAVLTGLQLAKTSDNDGKEKTSAVMFTDVFVKRKGKWMLSLAHAVDLPQIPNQYLPKK
ncbi:MAG: nuclear transport factor 2 family protein [Blastocatellales bacterium]